jgi:DNA-binding CsgD family transcriptional regulator
MIFKFLTVFLSLGFIMKILGEVVHEVLGHGVFILAFGGIITSIKISLLWPYELSHIGFAPPSSGFQPWQEVLVDVGGILMCLIVSFILQTILLLSFSKRANWVASAALFWLAFWTFINPAGYLIVGGIKPFGDVANLVSAGIITKEIALILGLLIFLINLFTLSIILKNVLRKAGVNKEARWSIVLFWLIVPLLTLFSVVGQGLPLLIALLGFIPVLAACAGLLLHSGILSHRKNRETRG